MSAPNENITPGARRGTTLRVTEGDGVFGALVELCQQRSGEDTIQVPMCDILVLALTRLLSTAHPAVEEAVREVQAAYEAMVNETDVNKAASDFNAVIGIEVYSVQQTV